MQHRALLGLTKQATIKHLHDATMITHDWLGLLRYFVDVAAPSLHANP
jgi:hypothetical protein